MFNLNNGTYVIAWWAEIIFLFWEIDITLKYIGTPFPCEQKDLCGLCLISDDDAIFQPLELATCMYKYRLLMRGTNIESPVNSMVGKNKIHLCLGHFDQLGKLLWRQMRW